MHLSLEHVSRLIFPALEELLGKIIHLKMGLDGSGRGQSRGEALEAAEQSWERDGRTSGSSPIPEPEGPWTHPTK